MNLREKLKKLVDVHVNDFTKEKDNSVDNGRMPFAHTRVYFNFLRDKNYEAAITFAVEWDAWSHFKHLYLKFKHPDDEFSRVSVSAAAPPLAVWFSLGGHSLWPIKIPKAFGRSFGIHVNDGATIYVDFAWDETNNDNKQWWSRQLRLPVADLVLGRREHSQRTMHMIPIEIPMPEGTYKATCEIFESTWKRKNWPFPEKMVRSKVDIPGGIPYPGKGTSAFNCGDDANYGHTGPQRTPEDAIAEVVRHVLTRRVRNGGRGWKPARVKRVRA
jgi:hypothetical protein